MHHYTYLITYKDGLKYMGVRSCKCIPADDTNYVGSSRHTPNKSEIVSKKILKQFNSRKEALDAEIHFHKENRVNVNKDFYNKAIQKSNGFDTSGTKLARSPEHNLKIKNALTGRKRSPEECLAISEAKKGKTGRKHSSDTKTKIGLAHKGKTVSAESINKMIATRLKAGNYNQSDSTREKISSTLKENPPHTTKVTFTSEGIETHYSSIKKCAEDTGISYNSLRGRLQRIPGKCVKGWSIR